MPKLIKRESLDKIMVQQLINNLSLTFVLRVSTSTKPSSGTYKQKHTNKENSVKDVPRYI